MSNTLLCKNKNPGRYQRYLLLLAQVMMILTFTMVKKKGVNRRIMQYRKKRLDEYMKVDETDFSHLCAWWKEREILYAIPDLTAPSESAFTLYCCQINNFRHINEKMHGLRA